MPASRRNAVELKEDQGQKMNISRNPRLRMIALLVAVLMHPADGFALDLGLTPSHVFSLWTNINESLVVVGGVVSDDKAWRESLTASKARKFEGKQPRDVLEMVASYRTKLDKLLGRQGLEPVKRFNPKEKETEAITPTVVYLNSGYVLNAQVTWLIVNTGPEQTVSRFYTRYNFSGKTPSDVLGLVELANRRLDKILVKAGL